MPEMMSGTTASADRNDEPPLDEVVFREVWLFAEQKLDELEPILLKEVVMSV